MKKQEMLFWSSEGDRYYGRNQNAMAATDFIQQDPALRLLKRAHLRSRSVLEIGCSDGWRLEELRKRWKSKGVGIEPSAAAIRSGQKSFPRIDLRRGVAERLPLRSHERFDLVIVFFVLHWVSREALWSSLSEIDRRIVDGGYLLIADFLPSRPTKVRYHHRVDQDVYTYKTDYAAIFESSGLYRSHMRMIFDHSTRLAHQRVAADRRAVCTLLKKSNDGYYVTAAHRPKRS